MARPRPRLRRRRRRRPRGLKRRAADFHPSSTAAKYREKLRVCYGVFQTGGGGSFLLIFNFFFPRAIPLPTILQFRCRYDGNPERDQEGEIWKKTRTGDNNIMYNTPLARAFACVSKFAVYIARNRRLNFQKTRERLFAATIRRRFQLFATYDLSPTSSIRRTSRS